MTRRNHYYHSRPSLVAHDRSKRSTIKRTLVEELFAEGNFTTEELFDQIVGRGITDKERDIKTLAARIAECHTKHGTVRRVGERLNKAGTQKVSVWGLGREPWFVRPSKKEQVTGRITKHPESSDKMLLELDGWLSQACNIISELVPCLEKLRGRLQLRRDDLCLSPTTLQAVESIADHASQAPTTTKRPVKAERPSAQPKTRSLMLATAAAR